MAKKLALVSGIPRMVDESASPTIYDQSLTVVSSAPGAGQILGPIAAGTPITLPSSQSYTSSELEVYLGPDRLNPLFDYSYSSSTQIALTFQAVAGDVIRFRIDRAP